MIKPLFNNVIVEPIKKEECSKSGLIVNSFQESTLKGKVIAIGSNCTEVKIGDIVSYEYSISNIELDKKYDVVREDNIFCIYD